MFDVGLLELAVIALVATLVLGPDKLPDLARQAAQLLHRARGLAHNARDELRSELGPDYADLQLRDLDPRSIVRKHLTEAMANPSSPILNKRTTLKDALSLMLDADVQTADAGQHGQRGAVDLEVERVADQTGIGHKGISHDGSTPSAIGNEGKPERRNASNQAADCLCCAIRKITNSAGFDGASPTSTISLPASTLSGGLVSASHLT
jgi:sec-independent protein translocase protein TatB